MSNKKESVKIEDIDNIEESAINIEMGLNQVFNIDSMIEEVSIDTLEEGEMIYKESIRSYITEQGEIPVNGLD